MMESFSEVSIPFICINPIRDGSVFIQCEGIRLPDLWVFPFTWQIHLALLGGNDNHISFVVALVQSCPVALRNMIFVL